MIHFHRWTTVQSWTLPSQAEILHGMGKQPNTHTSFIQKLVLEQSCVQCGKTRLKEIESAR
jgi:hypothetical protein